MKILTFKDWAFEIYNALDVNTAVVIITNGNSGKCMRVCTSSCTGSNGSSPVIQCDFTRDEAIKTPASGMFILTRT